MKEIKKIRLSQTPTPIELLKDFPHPAKIYIKRDDYTGLITSGNKVRKLEYCLAEALSQKADTIITCGGIQSNHCRTTAACCRSLGLTPLLLLRGEEAKPYDGNLLLDYLLGSQIRYISAAEYKKVDQIMADVQQELREKGRKAYIVPEGASNEVGLWGYVDCMAEMKEFLEKENIEVLYVAVGSGGTYAGLLLGKKIHTIATDVIGIIICDTVEYFTERIYNISKKAIDRFGIDVTVDKHEISLIDGYIGRGYSLSYKEEVETIKKVANHGIILDVAYTGKAFHGMLQESRKYKRILFVHTGGIFSIFPNRNDLAA